MNFILKEEVFVEQAMAAFKVPDVEKQKYMDLVKS